MTRPQIAAPQGAKGDAPKQPPRIQDMLQSPDMVKRMQAVLPRHLSPERMLRVMAQAVFKTPKLAECHPMTLLGAMMACASLGLEPNTPLGHAYLIPFEKRKKVGNDWVTERVDVNLIIGYKGLIDLARRSGDLESIHADVVYEGDEFSFEYGTNTHLRHVPTGDREGRIPKWAYAHAKLKGGGQGFEVLPYIEVLKIRNASQGYQQASRQRDGGKSSPWIAFEHEMAVKTMIRRLSKFLPASIEFANAAELDRMSDGGSANLAVFSDLRDSTGFDASLALTQTAEAEITPTVDAGEGEPQAEPVQQAAPAPQQQPAKRAAQQQAPAQAAAPPPPSDEPPPPSSDDFFGE